MIRIERVELDPELEKFQPEWDALLEKSTKPTVFSTYDFFFTSCSHFKEDEQVFLLFMRDDATRELLAIYPLSLDRERVHGVEIKVLAHGITTYATDIDKPYPIIREGCEEACWTAFRDWLATMEVPWDVLDYDEFLPGSYLTTRLSELFPFPRYWTRISEGPESPIVRLDGDWDTFWMAHRKLRKKTRRLEKVMGDNLVYQIKQDPADVDQCLSDYIATELISWKAGRFVSHPAKQKFYRDLLPKLAAKNRLVFGMLYDRDKVVSIEVAYLFSDRVFFAHGTYDPAYADLSPGTVNSGWLIRFLHGKGYTEGDYLAGFSSYNNPWACRIEQSVDVVVRRMGWKNWYLAGCHLASRLKRRAARFFTRPQDKATGGEDPVGASPEDKGDS